MNQDPNPLKLTPLQTLRAIFPWWYLLVFAPWVYMGFVYLLAPDATFFSGETGSFILKILAFFTVVVLIIGFTGNFIRLKSGTLAPPRFYFQLRPFLLLIVLPLAALIYNTIATTTPTYSQPASWQDLINRANQEAARIDKKRILIDVRAAEICCRSSHISTDSTLEVKFNYLRASNNTMRITLLDTNPPRITEIKADTREGFGDSNSPSFLAELTDQSQGITLSPRDAMRAALNNPKAPPLPAEGLDSISVTIYLQQKIYGTGLSRNWYVSYDTDAEPDSPSSFTTYEGKSLRMITFLIDPTDGHLVEYRDHLASLNNSAPQPRPTSENITKVSL